MPSRALRPSSVALVLASFTAATVAACGGGSSVDGASTGGPAAGSGNGAAGKAGAAGNAGSSGAGAKAGSAGAAAKAGSSGWGGATGGKAGSAGVGGAKAGNGGAGGATAGTGGAGGAKAGNAGAGGIAGMAGKGGGAGATAGSAGSAGAVQDQVISLVVIPATGTIDVVNGVGAPLQLAAKPVYKSGNVGAPVPDAVWSIKPGDRASVDANGKVQATGAIGGDATVTATWKGMSGSALVTIKLHTTDTEPSITPADKAALDGATTPDSAKWIYPYDKTVFPRGILAPELMWSAASAGDKMSVSIQGPYVDLKEYFVTSAPNHVLAPDLWSKATESGKGGPVTIKVARIAGGSGPATLVMSQTWTLASGSMRGTVYYWSNNLGRVVRIKAGASTPDDFLAAAGVNDGCTTCHTVSANGNVLVLGGGKATGDSAASVFDLLGNSLAASNYGRAWAMPALTPNGTFAVLNEAPLPGPPGNKQGGVWRVSNNTKVTGTGADSVLFDMPAFSPDGSKLVYVDHGSKALAAYDYAEPGGQPTLTNFRSLVAQGSSPIGFPSVSPDGKWGVYHRGPLDTRGGKADLFLTSVVSGGAEFPLDALNGATYPFFQGDRDRHWNYEPTFAPVPSGGYFWVVFTSRRTYGNKLVSDQGNTKQLWVAAVDMSPTPGQDPSHPAFRVPGQDNNWNMRGFWALDPCKDDGASCTQSSQCCGGACLSNGTCGQPPGQTCKPVGASCSQVSDCCGYDQGFQCINSHCTEPKP